MSQTVLEPVRMQHIAAFNFRIHSVGFVTLKNRKTFYIIDLWILYLILLHLSVTGKWLLSECTTASARKHSTGCRRWHKLYLTDTASGN